MLNRLVKLAAVAAGGYFATQMLSKKQQGKLNSSMAESINVKVPVSTAYNQWTQFEEFPKFMENVHEVTQIDDTHLRWRASVAGKEKEWTTEITEQIPDQRIAWRAIEGVRHAGVVTFHHIAPNESRIMLQIDYAPDGAMEQVGDVFGATRLQTKADLRRFKQMLEGRGSETGAWRGSVSH